MFQFMRGVAFVAAMLLSCGVTLVVAAPERNEAMPWLPRNSACQSFLSRQSL